MSETDAPPAESLEGAAPTEPKTPRAPRDPKAAPKWETDVKDRLKTVVRRFQKPLADLVQRDANEGDTRLLVTDMLCDGLGFDKYEDLTTEYAVKGDFADYGIRIDKQLVAFIEVKRATQQLNERHLRQAQMYAVNEGVEWIVVTNGHAWRAYHLTGGLPVLVDLAIDIDLLDDKTTPAQKVAQLFYLSRESLKRRQIDELWRQQQATSPKALAATILSDPVLEAIRKEVRRTSNHKVDPPALQQFLRTTVIRPEALPEAP